MRFVMVTGLGEVDKKTIIDLTLQRAGVDFEHIEFDEIQPIEKELILAEKMEDVNRIKKQFHERLEKILVGKLKERKDIVVSGYLTAVNQKLGFVPVLDESFFDTFKPDSIVIIELEPKIGEKLKPESIEHQKINREFAISYSSRSDSELKIIRIHRDEIMKAMNELISVIKG